MEGGEGLNPFENQVYFHEAASVTEVTLRVPVLIPLRIRSISTKGKPVIVRSKSILS